MQKNIVQMNIVQMKAKGERLRAEAQFCFDMAAHYAPGIMNAQGEADLRAAREADAAFEARAAALHRRWGRFSR